VAAQGFSGVSGTVESAIREYLLEGERIDAAVAGLRVNRRPLPVRFVLDLLFVGHRRASRSPSRSR
jgi:hypothetical protein